MLKEKIILSKKPGSSRNGHQGVSKASKTTKSSEIGPKTKKGKNGPRVGAKPAAPAKNVNGLNASNLDSLTSSNTSARDKEFSPKNGNSFLSAERNQSLVLTTSNSKQTSVLTSEPFSAHSSASHATPETFNNTGGQASAHNDVANSISSKKTTKIENQKNFKATSTVTGAAGINTTIAEQQVPSIDETLKATLDTLVAEINPLMSVSQDASRSFQEILKGVAEHIMDVSATISSTRKSGLIEAKDIYLSMRLLYNVVVPSSDPMAALSRRRQVQTHEHLSRLAFVRKSKYEDEKNRRNSSNSTATHHVGSHRDGSIEN